MLKAVEKQYTFRQGRKMPCYYYKLTDSTNERAKALIKEGQIRGCAVVCAQTQSRGKGRYDREFVSPVGGVYMTYVTPIPESRTFSALGAFSALAVCEVLAELGFDSIEIKWPNDVRLYGKKVCGVLPESVVLADGQRYVLIGVGVNVNTPMSVLGDFGISLCNSLRGEELDLSVVELMLAESLYAISEKYFEDTTELLERYRALCGTIGKSIIFKDKFGVQKQGLVSDVSDDGGLKVRCADGIDLISWGEVTELV